MVDISIIIPIYNGEKWIDRCFNSIISQTCSDKVIEVCICNDSSTDQTSVLIQKWVEIFKSKTIATRVYTNESKVPCGVGYAKNRAIDISSGKFLCFQDVDDVMLPGRLDQQYEFYQNLDGNYIIGSKFERYPPDSTRRFTYWSNNMTKQQLNSQIYTSNGPTIIMPTWFMHRNIFERVGGFSEQGQGTPEDLIFFYKHLDLGGKIDRVDTNLLIYQYHPTSTTFSIKEDTIWNIRIKRLEERILSNWLQFTIWNAGKQGRKFYNSLSENNQLKVVGMCDVDVNKIGKYYEHYNSETKKVNRKIPIVHFLEGIKPFIICVKMNLTSGNFEENLKSLNLKETVDYILFS